MKTSLLRLILLVSSLTCLVLGVYLLFFLQRYDTWHAAVCFLMLPVCIFSLLANNKRLLAERRNQR